MLPGFIVHVNEIMLIYKWKSHQAGSTKKMDALCIVEALPNHKIFFNGNQKQGKQDTPSDNLQKGSKLFYYFYRLTQSSKDLQR